MKNTLIISILFSLLATTLYSQSGKYSAFIGLNSSKIKSTYNDGTAEISDKVLLPEFGLYYTSSLESQIFFQTGIQFSNKGMKYEFDGISKVSITYLEVPLNYGYRLNIPNMNNAKIAFIGGGYLGYALFGKSKYKEDGEPLVIEKITSKDFKDGDLNRVNLGLGIGINLELQSKYVIGLKSSTSINNLYKDLDAGDRERFKNFTVGFSYVF